ncbi:MraY family glycosyltransferase [Aequorivita capsosiphonis]|uniref:MraY family glycosyltransferase n=1 Tax=Aequorivita capsosiphonis TaxID=487317 RepID=UPI0004083C02|nr:MraY family glycosyltransferase [Aequorivita capsosiphonis]
MILPNLPTNKAEVLVLLADFKLLTAFLTLATSLSVTLVIMPKVIAISLEKDLTASTNGRTSHRGIIPNLGGIGVFIGLILTSNIAFLLFASHEQLINLIIFNIVLSLLFLVGVSDDIMSISPRKKLFFELIAAIIFISGTNNYIGSFNGLLGIHELHYAIALPFSVFVIVLIINAYNLIDGIDGLAGSIGVLVSGVMAVVFFLSGHFLISLISLALVGSLVAFLIYNFSHKRKIFLGDTGSLVVGFALAAQMVLYLNLSLTSGTPLFKNAPLFVMALLSYPLLDTLRVFIVRIKKGQSPFTADRNHIHHRLIDLGLSHKRATMVVVLYTLAMIALAYLLNNMPINAAFAILLPVCMILVGVPFILVRKKDSHGYHLEWVWKVAEQEGS